MINNQNRLKEAQLAMKTDGSTMMEQLYEIAMKMNSVRESVEQMEDTFLWNMGEIIGNWEQWKMFVKLYRNQKYSRPHIGFVTSKQVYDSIAKTAQPVAPDKFQLLGFHMKIDYSLMLQGLQFMPLPNREFSLSQINNTQLAALTVPNFEREERERRRLHSFAYWRRGYF